MIARLSRVMLRAWLGLSLLWLVVAVAESVMRWTEIRHFVRPERVPDILIATAADIAMPVVLSGIGLLLVLLVLRSLAAIGRRLHVPSHVSPHDRS